MNGRFVNGDVFNVRASGNERSLLVILPLSLIAKYAVDKLSTDKLPTTYGEYRITWINNFKLTPRPGASIGSSQVEYELQFDKPDLPGLSDQRLFFYDGSQVIPADTADFAEITGNMIAARLRVGDPGVGWGGRQA